MGDGTRMGLLDTLLGAPPVRASASPITTSTPLQAISIDPLVLGSASSRQMAMSLPTAAMCRDLIASTVAQLRVVKYRGLETVDSGMLLTQPDPSSTWSAQIQMTVEDLLLFGNAAWIILATDGIATEANPAGLPVRARRVAWENVDIEYSRNVAAYDRITGYRVNGQAVPRDALIVFSTGSAGILEHGARALRAAHEIEEAARRFSTVDVPAGVLYSEGGHEIGPDEAAQLVDAFTTARQTRSIAFLQNAKYERVSMSPEELALSEMRAAADRDIARLFDVPVSMIAASPSGGAGGQMVYQNLSQNLTQFVTTAVAPILTVLEETLSLPTVTARGQRVRFDVDSYLRSDPSSSREHVIALLESGIINIDEARSYLGLGPQGSTDQTLEPGRI